MTNMPRKDAAAPGTVQNKHKKGVFVIITGVWLSTYPILTEFKINDRSYDNNINNMWGDLTNVSAERKSLVLYSQDFFTNLNDFFKNLSNSFKILSTFTTYYFILKILAIILFFEGLLL